MASPRAGPERGLGRPPGGQQHRDRPRRRGPGRHHHLPDRAARRLRRRRRHDRAEVRHRRHRGRQGGRHLHPPFRPAGPEPDPGPPQEDYAEFDKAGARIYSYDNAPRQKVKNPSAKEQKETFRDLRGTFTEKQVLKETERCLGCGATVVDQAACVGCGVCTTMCKFDAIKLRRVTTPRARNTRSSSSRAARTSPSA